MSFAPFSAGVRAHAGVLLIVNRTQVKEKATRTQYSGKSWVLGKVRDEYRKRQLKRCWTQRRLVGYIYYLNTALKESLLLSQKSSSTKNVTKNKMKRGDLLGQ